MDEETYQLLQRRDGELEALRAYAEALEEALREARGESAHERARDDADARIRELRYEHGFKSDGRWRD